MTLKAKLSAWGKLLRLPNLFTVPGDVIAGYVLAGGVIQSKTDILTLANLCAASLFAYIFGLITNDIADMNTDKLERPNRPIPSGAIALRTALAASLAAGAVAILFSCVNIISAINGVILVLCVYAYNFHFKGRKFYGAFTMALCRFFNVTLGVTIVVSGTDGVSGILQYIPCLVFAVGMLLYIHGVTLAAENETQTMLKRPGRRIFLTGAVVMYLTILGIMTLMPVSARYLVRGGIAALTGGIFLSLAYFTARLFAMPVSAVNTQKNIGRLIRSLILIQSAATAANGGITVSLILVSAYIGAYFSSKKFYGS